MPVEVDRREAAAAAPDVVVAGLFEGEGKDPAFPAGSAPDDAATGGLLRPAWQRGEVRGRRGEVTVFHRPDGRGRWMTVGLGPRARLSNEGIRGAAAQAIRAVRGKGARSLGFRFASFVTERTPAADAARALVDGAVLGGYEFLRYRTTADPGVEEVTLFLGAEHAADERRLAAEVKEERFVAENVVWTREIGNLPADTATPQRLAEIARELGKEVGLKVTVFDEEALARMGCGGLLAVGGGSIHPPRMIVLEYPGGRQRGRTVAVVGKGITFDSGGISIKPAAKMSDMKFDKSGAVAVLGILRAAARLKVPPRVIGVLCCAENLPSGSSYRPGDVVRTYSGRTIEVLNTDAEGRVVLADGLGYVSKEYRPDAIVDLATLTGAQVVALGDDTAGLVANDDRLAADLLAASAATGEPLWRMPLTDYHRELVKSDLADVRNSTEIPVAGMLTAAAFLESFVGPGIRWAHLDIAGPGWTSKLTRRYQPAYQNLGATGFGVRTLLHYLRQPAE
jgi:leucyl aminopeptidase